MPRISLARFREEVLAIYAPPARAKNSWFKVRQVLDIMQSLGVQQTTDLTPEFVPRFIAFNPDWKPETIKGLLGYLSPICKYAKTMGYLRVNPFEIRKDWFKAPALAEEPDGDDDWDWDNLAKTERHVPLADLSRLLDYLKQDVASWKGGRLYALVALFVYTGVRRNEGLTRAVKDFHLERQLIRVTARKQNLKTPASAQPVAMPGELVPILADWLPRAGSKWAFPGVRLKAAWTGGAIGSRPIDALKEAGQAVGIQGLTFQKLRHSWATHAELRGIADLMIKRQLRHTSTKTQLHYRHADTKNLVDAVEGFTLRAVGDPG